MNRYSFFVSYKDIARLDVELIKNFNFISKTIYHNDISILDIDTNIPLADDTKAALESYVLNFQDSDEKNSEFIYVPQSFSPVNISSTDVFETVFTWNYNGTLKERYLSKLGVSSLLNGGNTYTMRIYDIENNIILGELSLTNFTEILNYININIGKLSPLPTSLELQVNGICQLKSIQFVYKS